MENFIVSIEKGTGTDIILWFQSWRTDFVSLLFRPFDFAGTEIFFLLLLTIVYWSINKEAGRKVTIVFLVSAWLNAFFKVYWKRPRPYQVSKAVMPAFTADGYGLPSGHTQTSTSISAILMTEVSKRWMFGLLVLYMILMGISRMVHGVHFPQDVLLGWIIGVLIVVLYVFFEKRLSTYLTSLKLPGTILLTVIVTAVLIGLSLLTRPDLNHIASLITPAAVIAGVIPGFYFERTSVRFSTSGSFLQRCLRYLVGICIALVIKEGLKPLLELINDHSMFMSSLVRFIRYFVLGLWVSVGAPWLFVKTKLASGE